MPLRRVIAGGPRPSSSQALAQQTTRTTQVINAKRQLVAIQNQAVGSSNTLTGALRGVNSTMSALGATASVAALLKFAGDALAAANSLEKTQATVLALSGSQARYNEVLALATAGQQKYGGSLEENLGGLGSLVNLSNKAGVSLGQLDNIARRLAIVDPMQGIEGANAALKEFASGNIGTLATRFELSRSALRELNDESLSMAERFNALDAALAEMGISSAVLDNATKTNAATFTKLSAEGLNARDAIGALTASLLKVPAQVTTEILIKVTGGLQQLATADAQLEATQARLLEVAGSFDVYQQKLAFVNEQLAPFGAQVGAITEQQFAFAQGLIRSGSSAAEAMAKVREYGNVIQAGALAQSDWGAASDVLIDKMLTLAGTSDGNRAAIQNLSQAYVDGNITASTLEQAIARLATMQEAARQAAAEQARENRLLAGTHTGVASAADQAAAATQQATAETTLASVESQLLAARQAELLQAAQAAAGGMLAGADSASVLASQFGISSGEAQNLINKLRELAQLQNTVKFGLATEIIGSRGAAPATGALASGFKGLIAGAQQYEKTRTAIARGGGGARVSDAKRLDNQLLADQERFAEQSEEAARAHGERLTAIEREFEAKSLAQQNANDVSKRNSRADFYELAHVGNQRSRPADRRRSLRSLRASLCRGAGDGAGGECQTGSGLLSPQARANQRRTGLPKEARRCP